MDVTAITKYFDLNEHPFMTSPDPRFLYFSSQVKEALAKCEFMARDRIGPIYMYGPIGSGKTSLVRRLQEKLGQDERYNVKLLISPNLKSSNAFLRLILETFDVKTEVGNKLARCQVGQLHSCQANRASPMKTLAIVSRKGGAGKT